MGLYINKGNKWFKKSLMEEYVDKTGLITVINENLFTEFRFCCVSRCRRFGKSMAAEMLCAYYDKSCDSRELFSKLEIAKDPSFEEHLNKYPVIYLDLTAFVSKYKDDTIVGHMDRELIKDIHQAYPDIPLKEKDDLMDLLFRISETTGERFFFIIDEWDAICREFSPETKAMETYLGWLQRMFKSSRGCNVFVGAYLTGILPVPPSKSMSGLNNIFECSVDSPADTSRYFGFTKEEVRQLAEKHGMIFDDLMKWYDGYQIGDETSMFNPYSVMQAIRNKRCENFWGRTATFGLVADYFRLNYNNLLEDIIFMLSGGRCRVDLVRLHYYISEINSHKDVLTALVHLGYLSFDRTTRQCYIPNQEIAQEIESAIKESKWTVVINALRCSEQLLADTLEGNEEEVAKGIEAVHDDNISIFSYNTENSLSCVVSLAYYYARNDYDIHSYSPYGKGCADLVLIPRKQVSSPAVIIELNCGKSAEEAICQIKRRDYICKARERTPDILLVGINYDRETKKHKCIIERYVE